MSRKIPRRLILQKGELRLSDGGDTQDYLWQWQKEFEIKDGTPVNVIVHENLSKIISDAALDRKQRT